MVIQWQFLEHPTTPSWERITSAQIRAWAQVKNVFISNKTVSISAVIFLELIVQKWDYKSKINGKYWHFQIYIAKPPTKRIIPTVKSRCHILTVEAGLIILKYLTVLWTQIPSDYYANSGITMPPVPTRHRPLPASLQHTLH